MIFFSIWWDRSHPFASYGYLAWPLVFVVTYFVLLKLQQDIEPKIIKLGHLLSLWMVLAIMFWQANWTTELLIGKATLWRLMPSVLVPTLIAWLLMRTPAARYKSLTLDMKTYVVDGLIPLMVCLWGWLIYSCFAYTGSADPLPYMLSLIRLN